MAGKCVIVLLAALVACSLMIEEARADVHKGSCVWGAADYRSNCEKYCKDRGYKNGHCGSAFNVNCWCET